MDPLVAQEGSTAKPGCGGRLAAGFSLLLAIVFALSLPVALVLLDLGEVLFTPETVTEAVVSNVLETGALQEFLLQYFFVAELEQAKEPDSGSLQGALKYLEPAELQAILGTLIPPAWLESQITQIVNQFYAWLDNDQIYPKLVLDLQPIKDRLLSGGTVDIAEVVLDSWPSCSMEQINQARNQLARTGEFPLLACEPPEPMRRELLGYADEALQERVRTLPTDIRVFDPRADQVQPSEALELKESIRFLRAWSSSSWLLVFALLGLIMALTVRSFQDLARWWGYPLLVSGVLLFTLVLLVSEPFASRVARFFSSAELPGIFRAPIEGIAHSLQEAFVGLALIQFIGLFGAGMGLLLLAYLLRRRSKPQQ